MKFSASAGLLTTLLLASTAVSACPEYLNHSMRKLASKDVINFCEAYEGTPMLLVNTASNCGDTPQFEGLEALHQPYADQGVVIVGVSSYHLFPAANDQN